MDIRPRLKCPVGDSTEPRKLRHQIRPGSKVDTRTLRPELVMHEEKPRIWEAEAEGPT